MKVCIFSGCDYVDNLKGLGFGTLINNTSSEQSLDDYIDQILEMNGKEIIPPPLKNALEYFHQVNLTFAGFYNQLVFDKNKIKNLNEFSCKQLKDFEHCQAALEEYVGCDSYFSDEKKNQKFSQGLLKIDTMTKREPSDYDYEKSLLFIQQKQTPSEICLNNLCSYTYSFKNFDKHKIVASQEETDSDSYSLQKKALANKK